MRRLRWSMNKHSAILTLHFTPCQKLNCSGFAWPCFSNKKYNVLAWNRTTAFCCHFYQSSYFTSIKRPISLNSFLKQIFTSEISFFKFMSIRILMTGWEFRCCSVNWNLSFSSIFSIVASCDRSTKSSKSRWSSCWSRFKVVFSAQSGNQFRSSLMSLISSSNFCFTTPLAGSSILLLLSFLLEGAQQTKFGLFAFTNEKNWNLF